MKKSKFTNIFYEVMEEIYQNSIPSASFKELLKTSPKDADGKILIPFDNYTCSDRIMDDIIEKAIKKYHLQEPWRGSLKTNVYLGPSPRSLRKK